MKHIQIFIIMAILLTGQLLFGQAWEGYTVSNSGLASNIINDVVVDETNRAWIATDKGLAKFDGNNWNSYTTTNSGLPSDKVHCVSISKTGHILMGTNSGLAIYDGYGQGQDNEGKWRGWTIYNMNNSPLPRNVVSSIVVDHFGVNWIGTLGGGGLVRFNGTEWKVFTTNNSDLPNNYIQSLAITANNRLWIGTNYGLSEYDGINWRNFNTSNSDIPSNSIKAVAVDENNTVYVGTTNSGFAIYSLDSVWMVYNKYNSPLPEDNISSISVVNKNLYWIGTESNGLIMSNNGNWRYFSSIDSNLISNKIKNISIDSKQWKWIATENGLSLYKEVSVTGVKILPEFLIIPNESTHQLTALITPYNATNMKVSWGVTDANILSVTETGFVLATKPGRAVVSVITEDSGYRAVCEVEVTGKVNQPLFNPEEGEYKDRVTVIITTETEEAEIYYTTDGKEPTKESLLYSEPIEIAESTTLKAIAFREHWEESEVTTAEYYIVTSVSDDTLDSPEVRITAQVYPNPLTKSSVRSGEVISFDIFVPKVGELSLDIYDIKGRRIKTFDVKGVASGNHIIQLDASEKYLSNGVYLYKVHVGNEMESGRFTIIR